jgi:hypothetical protein
MMDASTRFYNTIHYGNPDRVPYFEEGIRTETLDVWRAQGLPDNLDPQQQFPSDKREEIRLDLDPHPGFEKWPTSITELDSLRERFNPADPDRLPKNWQADPQQDSDRILMVRVHEGFFLTMGVHGAKRFNALMYLLFDNPEFVRECMRLQGQFAARLTERILRQRKVDALVFSEPIGDNNGALISPRMYEDFVLPYYQPLLDLAKQHGVKTLICRTYANMKALIPSLLKQGINCLWACEVEQSVMNYPALRKEFGRDLRLIGGIDLDALREGKDAIRKAIDNVAPLLAQGGYIPLADGRVRADIPYENYCYYRERLRELAQ